MPVDEGADPRAGFGEVAARAVGDGRFGLGTIEGDDKIADDGQPPN
jgi:hypothetical protein